MARKLRQIERLAFRADEPAQIIEYMKRLADAGDGWINLLPNVSSDDERPTSLGFLTLVGGGALGVTMCTWIPASHNDRRRTHSSLGIAHLTAHRAAAQLASSAVPIPATWFVEQDHRRRGLVMRVPSDEPHGQVLEWALRAADALSPPRPERTWRADVYLPAAPQHAPGPQGGPE